MDVRTRVAIAGLALAAFAFITAETLPIALLPLIADGLRVPQTAVGLLVTGYALVVLVATVPLTRLTVRLPRRALLGGVMVLLVIATAGGAASPDWGLLLAARLLTALAHAVFWAVVVPTAAGLVAPERRGRAVSAVYAGQSVAVVAGVPLATVLGGLAGWRAAFLAVAGMGALAVAVAVPLLPRTGGAAARTGTGTGTAPDARGYAALVVVTVLAVTGSLAAFTYVNPFLTEVSGVPEGAVGLLLSVRGVAGLLAVLLVGRLVDRHPLACLTVPLAVQALALAVQWAGAPGAAAVVAITVSGAAGAGFSAALGTRVLVVAPGSIELATAGTSTAYNGGIMLGSALGGAVLARAGLVPIPLVAAGFVLAALGLVGADLRRPTRSGLSSRGGGRPARRRGASAP